MDNNEIYKMTDEDLKILKRTIMKLKKSKIFKQLNEFKESKNADIDKAA